MDASQPGSGPDPDYADYVFVGGGLTSATAAKTVREHDRQGRIVVISAEEHVPYHRPPLSKEYLKGEADFTEAQIAPKEEFDSQKIEVWTGVRASKLDPSTKTVSLDNGKSLQFGKLCVATGAAAKPLDPEKTLGADAPNVLTLRTVEDSDRLRSYLKAEARVIIVGAGYVGMEVAAVRRQKGLEVTVVDSHEHPWSKNTYSDFGAFLRRYYEMNGVHFLLEDSIRRINKDVSGNAVSVEVTSGSTLPCDFVVAGVGAKLNLELLQQAGLKAAPKEGVSVDKFLQTEAKDIYAAGDIACFEDPVLEKFWQNAEWHGQIAGANMAAVDSADRIAYDHVPYFFSDEFDLHMTLRGDPQAGKRSFAIGSVEPDTSGFLELYLRDDGTLAMGIILSKNEDESATSYLQERLIRAKARVAHHQEALQSGTVKIESPS